VSGVSFATDEEERARPKMIWAMVRESTVLAELYHCLGENYRALSFKVHPARARFTPHLTLARFNTVDLGEWEGEGLPHISTDMNLSFTVRSIEIMESKLSRSGSKFSVLQSIPLRES
jgi:2'-5' RNA ligase